MVCEVVNIKIEPLDCRSSGLWIWTLKHGSERVEREVSKFLRLMIEPEKTAPERQGRIPGRERMAFLGPQRRPAVRAPRNDYGTRVQVANPPAFSSMEFSARRQRQGSGVVTSGRVAGAVPSCPDSIPPD
jgi:hypothetical protein